MCLLWLAFTLQGKFSYLSNLEQYFDTLQENVSNTLVMRIYCIHNSNNYHLVYM